MVGFEGFLDREKVELLIKNAVGAVLPPPVKFFYRMLETVHMNCIDG
jgi:hypothetical protein